MTAPERPISFWQGLRPLLSVIFAGLAGIVYGLLTRLAFGLPELSDLLTTLSLGFLVLTPLALGVITVVLAPACGATGRTRCWRPPLPARSLWPSCWSFTGKWPFAW